MSRFNPPKRRRRLGTESSATSAPAATGFNPPKRRRRLGTVPLSEHGFARQVSIRPSGDAAWERECRGRWWSVIGFNPPKRRRRLGTAPLAARRRPGVFQSAQAATPLGNVVRRFSPRARVGFNPPKRRRRLGTSVRVAAEVLDPVSIRPSGDAAWELAMGRMRRSARMFQSAQAATPLGNYVRVAKLLPSAEFQSAQAATPLGNGVVGSRSILRDRFNPPKRRRRLGTRTHLPEPRGCPFQSAQAATPLGNADLARSLQRVVVSIRPSGDAAWERQRRDTPQRPA